MIDVRVNTFAQNIVKLLDIVEDDVVLILCNEHAYPLLLELQKEILNRLAFPNFRINFEQLRYNFYKYGKSKHFQHFPEGFAKDIELATKVISIESSMTPRQISRISQSNINAWKKVAIKHYQKLDFIPGVVTVFPNPYYANQACMSLEEYEKVFYKAVSVNLEKLYDEYTPIEQMLSSGNKIQIKTSNTDLTFKLGERNFAMRSLLMNLPDGEIYCSPIENSVNGYVYFDNPQFYSGKIFRNLSLEFKDGKIVNFDSDTEKEELEKILKTDSGSDKLGEFGIGINPALTELTNDILFDEKVVGTIHLALGNSHREVAGTNRSVIHFDMIKDMRGEGIILLDERVIYREGNFVKY